MISTSFAGCSSAYQDKISSPIVKSDVGIGNLSGTLSYVLMGFGLSAWAATGVAAAVPAVYYGSLAIAKAARNAPLKYNKRVIDYSGYTVTGTFPRPDLSFEKEIPVDGKKFKERKKQRKINRSIRRRNRAKKRANKRMAKEVKRAQKAFNNFHEKVSESALNTGVDKMTLAQSVVELDEKDFFCSGELGLFFGPSLSFKDYVVVNGATKKIRKKQRRKNKRIARYNKRVARKMERHQLATKKEWRKYFTEVLSL